MSDQKISLVPQKHHKKKKPKKGLQALKAKVDKLSQAANLDEVKYATGNIAATQIDYNGSLNSLVTISQGAAGVNQRLGDSVALSGINFRYVAYITTTTAVSQLRIILLVDEQANLSTTNVLATTGSILAPLSFYNKEYRGRYKILYDETHTLDAGQSYQDIKRVSVNEMIPIKYAPGLSTVRENDVRVLLISNQAPASVDRPYVFYNVRCWYKEA